MLAGVTGAVLSVLAIFAGKFIMVSLLVQQLTGTIAARDVNNPEVLVTQLAMEEAGEMTADDRPLVWPRGSDYTSGNFHELDREDFPAVVWTAAQKRWDGMTPDERQEIKSQVERQNKTFSAASESTAANTLVTWFAFWFTFGWFDLLWIFLATTTAFRLSMGITGDD